jgi:ribosome-binding factor A
MATKRRVYRVAERIQSVIAQELHRLSDPRFFLVTITSVVVSPDLRVAKIYWMVTGGAERAEEVGDAFDAANGIFRAAISKELNTKILPELRFYYDNSLDAQEEFEEILARIKTS